MLISKDRVGNIDSKLIDKINGAKLSKKIDIALEQDKDTSQQLMMLFAETSTNEEILNIAEYIADNRLLSSHPSMNAFAELILSLLTGNDGAVTVNDDSGISGLYKVLLSKLVVILYYQKNYEGIDKCYAFFKKLNNGEFNKEAMIICHYEGLVLSHKKYYYDAIRFYDKALKCAEKTGEHDYKGRIYDCLGRAFGDKGLFKEAFQYYNMSIEMKKIISDKQGLAMTLGNKGRLHINTGEYDEALECFQKDLEIAEKINDNIGSVIMLSQVGNILWIKQQTEEAIEYYEKSKSLAERVNNRLGIGFAVIGLINCHLDFDNKEEFNQLINEFKEEFIDKENHFKSEYYKIIGKYYEKEGNKEKAEEYYLEALQASDDLDPVDKGLLNERLAVLYSKTDDYPNFKKYIMNSIKIYEETSAFRHLKRAMERFKTENMSDWLIYKFEGFLGKKVINNIITENTVEHVGEKIITSVLFSDIRGFTSFSEKIKPEDLIETLNDYLSVMSSVIDKYNGDIDKFIGDAIMAVYSSANTDKQNAINSVLSAWYMIKELYIFNKTLLDKKKPPMRIGIGIHSGEVIAGTMGSTYRKNYTVIGDTVNTSSRIEGLTKKYGVNILVTESTYKLCIDDPTLHFREIDRVKVKGKDKPLIIYELFAVGDLSFRNSEILKEYNRSLELFKHKEFRKALDGFKKLYDSSLEEYSAKLYLIYMERCLEYIKNPPSDNWDGVITFNEK